MFKQRAIIKVQRLMLALTMALMLSGCKPALPPGYQGYAEGEYVFIASPFAGQLEQLAVARGQKVEAGKMLFVLEHGVEQAAVVAALARSNGAAARIENLVGSRRAPEIAALRAAVERAQAAHRLAQIQLEQNERLYAQGFIANTRIAEMRAVAAESAAQSREAQAQMNNALQSVGRSAEIDAARADLEAASAELAQAKVRLDQKTGAAPTAALVQDTFYRQGEWVAAGSPILSLLPPANVKVRFFVPEAIVGTLREGAAVQLNCDGCAAPIAARISYIAVQAEYTPPIIYSRESRDKLVFMIEARPQPTDATRLHPGQPVQVTLGAPASAAGR